MSNDFFDFGPPPGQQPQGQPGQAPGTQPQGPYIQQPGMPPGQPPGVYVSPQPFVDPFGQQPKKGLPQWIWIVGGIGTTVLLAIVVFTLFAGENIGFSLPGLSSPGVPAQRPTDSFWFQFARETPQDRSPLNSGAISSMWDIWVAIFGFGSLGLLFLELKGRTVHQGALVLAISSAVVGVLSVPLINVSASWTIIWQISILIFFGFLVGIVISGIYTHKDLTQSLMILLLSITMLYWIGEFRLPQLIGQFANKPWPTWEGVYGLVGLLRLFWSGNYGQAALSLAIFMVSLLILIMASYEAGKKLKKSNAFFLALIMLVTFIASYHGGGWVLYQLFPSIASTSDGVALVEFARPFIAIIVALIFSYLAGTQMGDSEQVVAEQQMFYGVTSERKIITLQDWFILAVAVGQVVAVNRIFV